jgi:hypothetical protein
MTWSNLPQIVTAIGTVLGGLFLLLRWILGWRIVYDQEVWKRMTECIQARDTQFDRRLKKLEAKPKRRRTRKRRRPSTVDGSCGR